MWVRHSDYLSRLERLWRQAGQVCVGRGPGGAEGGKGCMLASEDGGSGTRPGAARLVPLGHVSAFPHMFAHMLLRGCGRFMLRTSSRCGARESNMPYVLNSSRAWLLVLGLTVGWACSQCSWLHFPSATWPQLDQPALTSCPGLQGHMLVGAHQAAAVVCLAWLTQSAGGRVTFSMG